MIYTAQTKKALKICFEAHKEQVDKSGLPYVFHPFLVAEQMTDELSVCVALLHDVLEDTPVTMAELKGEFPPEVLETVQLLTYDHAGSYEDYIRGVKKNPLAVKVKTADILHNADETRLDGRADGMLEEKRIRWRRKYQEAMEILKSED